MSMPEHIRTGLRGEQLTARYLHKKGWRVVDSNFTTKLGETDIIALDREKTLRFVEVKTRAPGTLFPPSEAVDAEKQKRLMNNAVAYIKTAEVKFDAIAFDIAEVVLHDMFRADINYITDAF